MPSASLWALHPEKRRFLSSILWIIPSCFCCLCSYYHTFLKVWVFRTAVDRNYVYNINGTLCERRVLLTVKQNKKIRGDTPDEDKAKRNKQRESAENRNIMGDYQFCALKFYTGDFAAAKEASKNPKGFLGWSGRFIRYGIRLFMLYLYDEPLPSIAMTSLAGDIDYAGDSEPEHLLDFEREIIEESLCKMGGEDCAWQGRCDCCGAAPRTLQTICGVVSGTC